MPVDIRHVTLTLGAIVAVIWLLKNTQDVLIPFVVSGLLFYALDPFVDRLERWRVPRAIGALAMLLTFVGAVGATGYYLSDQFMSVVEQVPHERAQAARRSADAGARRTGAISKVQQAADAIDRTAAEGTRADAGAARRRARAGRAAARSAWRTTCRAGWKTLPALAGVA